MSARRLHRLSFLLAAAFVAGCVSAPEVRPDAQTPDIPERSAAPSQQTQAVAAPAVPREQLGSAQVVKTVPAPSSEVTASEVTAAPDERPATPAQTVAEIAQKTVIDPEAKASFNRGNDAVRVGNLVEAENQFKLALQRDPKLTYAWTNLGVVYERRGDNGAAEDAYQKALDLDPENAVAWDYLARLRCRIGRASDVEAKLRLQIEKTPAALGPRLALVYTLLYQKKHESAANEAKKVLKADEKNVLAMQLLARAYYREKKYELAKMILENARALNANDAATWNALGLVALALDNKQQAMEDFKQAVALQPDFAEANNNYGALLNETSDYEGAVKVLEAAVHAAPDFAEAHLNLANAYRGKQDFPRAIAEYEQVTKVRPQWADTYYNLAILHLDSELPGMETIPRLKQAITYFLTYQQKGGKDDRVAEYMQDANKGIERESKRLERLEKDKLRKAAKEAEEKKKAEELARKKAEDDAKARAEADAAAAKAKAEADAAAAKAKAEEKKKAEAAAAHTSGTTVPASKLGEEDEGPAPTNAPPPPRSSKLGGDEK